MFAYLNIVNYIFLQVYYSSQINFVYGVRKELSLKFCFVFLNGYPVVSASVLKIFYFLH